MLPFCCKCPTRIICFSLHKLHDESNVFNWLVTFVYDAEGRRFESPFSQPVTALYQSKKTCVPFSNQEMVRLRKRRDWPHLSNVLPKTVIAS